MSAPQALEATAFEILHHFGPLDCDRSYAYGATWVGWAILQFARGHRAPPVALGSKCIAEFSVPVRFTTVALLQSD
jgi:hypothetical protein